MRIANAFKYYILLNIVASFLGWGCKNSNESSVNNSTESFRKNPVVFTRHAKCIMSCQEISEREIEHLISSGKVNGNESYPNDKPYPTYAVEGLTADSQYVRVVLGEYAGETRVITVINLINIFNCNCK